MSHSARAFNAQRIKGIVFDKDGTLLDFHATWVPKVRQAARVVAADKPQLIETMLAATGYDAGQDRVLSGSIIAAGSNKEISEVWARLTHQSAKEVEKALSALFTSPAFTGSVAVPNLKLTLSSLAALGLKLGVATMDNEAGIKATLGQFGCLDLFDYSVGYDSGYGTKPGPGMVLGFCKTTGLAPEEVMVVGDNTHDLRMGQSSNAGFNVGVLTGTSLSSDLEPDADLVLDSIADLPALWAQKSNC